MNKVYVIMWCNNSESWDDYEDRIVEICKTRQTARNHLKKYNDDVKNTSNDKFWIDEYTLNEYNYFF